MSRPAHAALLLALLTTVSSSRAETAPRPPHRREARVDFRADPAFQDRGGVQYFFELLPAEGGPEKAASFRALKALDVKGVWEKKSGPLHVMLSRIVYTLEREAGSFSAARTQDVAAMNKLLPGYDIRRVGPGTYRSGKTPANTFTVRHVEGEALARAPERDELARLTALDPSLAPPASVVLQENYDFARVMGFRTSERSYTWTAHHPLSPGRTRVVVYSFSLVHNLPPFFLGGPERMHTEALDGTLDVIQNLRSDPEG
jgi:hypothetical protein